MASGGMKGRMTMRGSAWTVFTACMALFAAFGASAQTTGDPDDAPAQESPSTTAVPLRPRPGPGIQPGGLPAPDAIRKRLDNIKGPKTTVTREPTGATTAAAATPTPTPAPAATASGATGSGGTGGAGNGTTGGTKIGTGLIETNPKSQKPIPWNTKISISQIDDSDLQTAFWVWRVLSWKSGCPH